MDLFEIGFVLLGGSEGAEGGFFLAAAVYCQLAVMSRWKAKFSRGPAETMMLACQVRLLFSLLPRPLFCKSLIRLERLRRNVRVFFKLCRDTGHNEQRRVLRVKSPLGAFHAVASASPEERVLPEQCPYKSVGSLSKGAWRSAQVTLGGGQNDWQRSIRERDLMEYLVAVILGLAVAGFAAASGFDRDRAFYPTVLIVIGSYYSLFAVMGASGYSTLGIEIAVGLVFAVFAVLGFKNSMWVAAAGIAGHGLFDFLVHPVLVTNPGMPVWWPGFCGTIDIVLGGWLAIRLWRMPKLTGVGGAR